MIKGLAGAKLDENGDVVRRLWQTTGGAARYEVRRATRRRGPYRVLSVKEAGRHFTDTSARPGETYFYTVTAVNSHGPGGTSHAIRTELPKPASLGLRDSGWRDDALRAARPGSTAVRGFDRPGARRARRRTG